MKIFLLVVFCVLLANLIRRWLKPLNPRKKNDRQIRKALQRLLKRPFGAYLVVEEQGVGKFVQFTGSIEEPLVFDLPGQVLTLDEFERARQLFVDLDYSGPDTFEIFATPGGEAVGTQTSFLVPFGDDIASATELALEVFAKVYLLGHHVSLKLTEK